MLVKIRAQKSLQATWLSGSIRLRLEGPLLAVSGHYCQASNQQKKPSFEGFSESGSPDRTNLGTGSIQSISFNKWADWGYQGSFVCPLYPRKRPFG